MVAFVGLFVFIYFRTRRFYFLDLFLYICFSLRDVIRESAIDIGDYIPTSDVEYCLHNGVDYHLYQENLEKNIKNINNTNSQKKKNSSSNIHNHQSSLERVKGRGATLLSAGTDNCEAPTGHGCLFDDIGAHIQSLTTSKKVKSGNSKLNPRSFLVDLEMSYTCFVDNLPRDLDVSGITSNALLRDTPFGFMIPDWLGNATLASILVILRSLNHHELESVPSHPYTKIRSEYVKYAIMNYANSPKDLCGAFALITNLCPTGVTIMNYDSSDRFPIDASCSFVRDRDIYLNYDDVNSLKGGCYFGDINPFATLATGDTYKCQTFNRARWSGIITSLVAQGKSNKEIVSVVLDNYPPLQRIIKYVPPTRKNPIPGFDVKCGRNGLWFISLMPRCAFYLVHDSDFINVYNVWKSLVNKLVHRLTEATNTYADVARMHPDERREILAARSMAFADILRRPDCQAMFAAGMSQKEVYDYVISSKRGDIISSKVSKSAMYDVKEHRKAVKHFNIGRARDEKYDDIYSFYEPTSIAEYMFDMGRQIGTVYDSFAIPRDCRLVLSSILVPLVTTWFFILYIYEVTLGPIVEYFRRWQRRVDVVEESIRSWLTSFQDVFTVGTDKPMMVHLLEIKTICHIIFELYAGTKRGALSWASNLVITRGSSVYSLLTTINDQAFGVQTHSGADQVVSSLCSILANQGVRNITEEDLRRFNTEMTAARFRAQSMQSMYTVATAIIRQMSLLLFGYDPMSSLQSNFAGRCVELIALTKGYLQTKPNKREEMTAVINLYELNKNNEQNSLFETLPTHIKSAYIRYFRELEGLAAEARNALIGDADRCEPVVVLFCGAPKSGKTTAMHTVRALLANHYYGGKKETYSVNGYSQYFEGYRNQPFVIMDDQFVNADPAIRAEEIQKFIGMVNTTPYPLNMAFGDKGKVFFNSDFIFVTTNAIGSRKVFNAAIADEEAFYRRMHIIAERDDPMSNNPTNDIFTIIRCVEPAWENARVNSVQLAKMCSQLRDRFKARYEQFKVMRTNLDVVKLSDIPDYEPHGDREFLDNPDGLYLKRLFRVVSNKNKEHVDIPDEEGPKDMPGSDFDREFRRRYQEQENRPREAYSPPIPTNAISYIRNYFVAMTPEDSWWSKDWVRYLVILFLFLAATSYAVYFIFSLTSDDDDEEECETYVENSRGNILRGSGQKRNRRRKQRQQWGQMEWKKMETRNYNPTSGKQIDVSHVNRCTAVFIAKGIQPSSGNWIRTRCIATHIADGVFIFPYHWHWDFKTPGDEWTNLTCTMTVRGVDIPFQYDMHNIVTYSNLDMLSIYVPNIADKLPAQALKFAPDAAIVDNLPEDTLVSLVLSSGRPDFTGNLLSRSGPVKFSSGPLELTVEYPLYYNIFSEKGDSGAPVVWVAPNNQRYIIGMHVGLVNRSSGVCVPLDIEAFEHIVKVTKPTTTYDNHSCVTGLPLPVVRFADRVAHLPRETKIKRTPLFGYAGAATTAPARLKPFYQEGVIVDPVVKAMAKLPSHDTRFQWLDDDVVKQNMIDYLFTHYPKHDSRLLTWEEVVNGVPVWNYPSVDGTTSAGYPYCLSTTKGKAPYITFCAATQKHIVSEELMERVIYCEDNLASDGELEFLWMDVLKDETRPLAKVEEGKTRLIATCPVDFLMLVRKYFGCFVAYLHTKCVKAPVAVGINVHSSDWYMLYSRFVEKDTTNGWSFLAGDFQNYDGKVPFQLGDIVVDYINQWYDDGPVNAKIRRELIKHVHHPTRICERNVYKVFGGNVSGNPITSEYNSLIQTLMWYSLARKYDVPVDGLEMSFYGDDSLVAIRAVGITTDVVARNFKEMFDMDYTHSSKAEFRGVDTINTATYLGRRFVPIDCPGSVAPVVLAPLDIIVIREILYFHKSSANTFHENFAQSLRSFVIEMSHHPREVFRAELRKAINAVLREFTNTASRESMVKILSEYSYEMLLTIRYREQAVDHIGRLDFGRREYLLVNTVSEGLGHPAESENKTASTRESVSSEPLEYETHASKVYMYHNMSCREEYPVSNTTTTTDNAQYTDRAANAPVPTQTVELGHYHDTAPIVSTAMNGELVQSPYRNINMETFDLSEVLKREYEMSSINWPSTANTNTYIATYNFPEDLLTQPFIADKIRGFRNFVTGVRVSFRMSSNTFNYGRLMVVYRPDIGDDPFASRRATNVEQISGFPHVLISASSSEVGVLDIPFVHNRRAIDRSGSADPQLMGSLSVIVLNPLTNTYGVASNVTVFVTAQFMDFKMYVPYSPTSGMEESIDKSKNNIISGVLEKTADIASMVKSVPFISGYASAYEGTARLIAAGAKMVGLDKPTSLARTNIDKVNPYSDVANSRGIDCSNKIAVDPENKISTVPNVAGQTVDEMDINYICGTPTLVSVFSVGTNVSVGTTLKICDTDVVRNNWTYAAWISDMCGYHSGSCKVKIYISASTMHACRVIFFVNTLASKWQDCYHKVVDILGDTEVEMTLPYTSTYLVRTNPDDTTVDDPTMTLWMRVVSYSQPQTAVNTPIYFNTYLAAASDFKVYMPLDRIVAVTGMPTQLKADVTEYEPHSNPRVDFSKPFDPIHPSVRGFEHDGLVMGEQIRSYRDFVHRYSPIRVIDPLADTSVYEGLGNFGPYGYLGLEMYGLIFQFWRGSIRFKLMQSNNNLNSITVMHEPLGLAVSGTTLSSGVNPLLEFEVPYYSPLLYRGTGQEAPLNFRGSGVHDMYLVKAAGDDFSFHFLCPPPTYNLPSNNNCGITGLATFLTNSQP